MIKLTYRKRGTGKTLILIHAFPFSSKMWDGLVSQLSDLDVSIATIDLPGFGGEPNTEWTMQSLAQALNDAIAAEGITRPILCGLSMGGYIALSYCKFYPDSVGGLILANTKAAADADEVRRDREAFAKDALKRGAIAAIERNLSKMTSDSTKQNAAHVSRQIESWMREADPQAIANALRAMAGRPDTMELLPTIDVPVLLIAGEDDKVTPQSEMMKMKARLPNAQFIALPKTAHMSVNEKPEEFARAVREYLM